MQSEEGGYGDGFSDKVDTHFPFYAKGCGGGNAGVSFRWEEGVCVA
jgi:hypothetical protein